jgi:hypothetical protein
MARKMKSPPATQDQLNDIADGYSDQIAKIADLYFEARRTHNNARCAELWEHAQYLYTQKRRALVAALYGTT